jgi:ribosomal protein S19E (S16A)
MPRVNDHRIEAGGVRDRWKSKQQRGNQGVEMRSHSGSISADTLEILNIIGSVKKNLQVFFGNCPKVSR